MKNSQRVEQTPLIDSFEVPVSQPAPERESKIIDINSFVPAERRREKIAIYQAPFYHIFPIKDIVYLEADGPYTHIHTESKKTLTACTNLRSYEEVLGEYNFLRIHKSHMINLSKVSRFCKSEGGYVLMNNNQKLYISSSKRDELIQRLEREVIVITKGSRLI
jgi:two-component system, LytTR family, response regulator